MPVPMSRNCHTPSAARYATVRRMKARLALMSRTMAGLTAMMASAALLDAG